ncbi:MAG: protein-disulfide reductase DsbD family protein [Alphaproteobacteria bacterium]|nr:protein-disulfide reductase DsbD family protein [Alphaproteobacteria bacterium]
MMFRASIAVILGLAGLGAPAAAQFQTDGPMVEASLVSDRSAVAPGETVHLALHQEIRPGWHTYWRNPGDSGEPTRWELSLPAGWRAGEMVWPAPTAYPLGPLTNYGYSDTVTLPVRVSVPDNAAPGPVTIPARATWLVCEDICIPEEADLSITLDVGESVTDPAGAALIDAAFAAAPEPGGDRLGAGVEKTDDALVLTLAGDALAAGPDGIRNLEVFPVESGIIDHAAPQPSIVEAGQARVDLKSGYLSRSGLPGPMTLVLTFERRAGGGWAREALELTAETGARVNTLAAPALSSSPGAALPGGGAIDQGAPAAPQSLSFLQAAAFALIGGLILNLMPCVFPVLSMKAITLVEKRGAERGEARLLGLIFAAGVIGTFLALGALLLVLRTAGLPDLWGVQLQTPAVVAGLALLMFLIGLNFLGLFEVGTSLQTVGSGVRDTGRGGAFLTGVLAVFVAAPCLAPFMTGALAFALSQPAAASLTVFAFLGVGLAAPFVLVSLAPGLLGFLPKPGPWMVRLRQGLAFPMFATAIWLVWVLVAQVGAIGVIWSLVAFLTAGFAIWAFSLKGAVARIAGVTGIVLAAGSVAAASQLDTVETVSPSGSAWAQWSPEAVAAARAEGRPVFVDFTAAWCVTCQVNKLGPLSSGPVKDAFAAHDVALFRADFTNHDDAIAAELARHGAPGVPLYLVFPADGGAPAVLPPLLTNAIVIQALERAVEGRV